MTISLLLLLKCSKKGYAIKIQKYSIHPIGFSEINFFSGKGFHKKVKIFREKREIFFPFLNR